MPTINGTSGNDNLTGTSGDDQLYGFAGDDILNGGDGTDSFYDGDGSDQVNGGAGEDYVMPSPGAGNDAYDGGADVDHINYTFALAGVIVDLSAGQARSMGGADAAGIGVDQLVSIENVSGTGFADILTGNSQDNFLGGYDGDDQLAGNDGNDRFEGGAGNDLIDGGAGVDTALFNNATSGLTINLNITTAQNTGDGIDTLVGIENVWGGQHSDVLIGNELDNEIGGWDGADHLTGGAGNDTLSGGTGDDQLDGGSGNDVFSGEAGNDQLWGGEGNDTLYSQQGNDLLDGGAGADLMGGGSENDTYVVDDNGDSIIEYDNQGTDTVQSSVAFFLGANLENLVLTGGAALNGWGNSLANQMTGNGAANVLYGQQGNDALAGNAGDDKLYGGDGDDTLDGGAGEDLLYGEAGNDALLGGAGNDGLQGGDGADSLYGDAGDDGLMGGAGNDLLDGGDNGEYGDFANYIFGNGVTVDLSIVGPQFISWAEGTDTLVNVENVTGSDQDDQITGNAGANILHGNWGWDVLNGAGGIDSLDAGDGLDTYIIASSSEHTAAEISDSGVGAFDMHDMLYFTTGAAETLKLFAGDTGLEYVFISDTGGNTSGTVAANIDASLVANSLTISGNDGANILKGTDQYDTLNGNGGVDRLYGNGGDDWVNGGEGDDYLYGLVGNDTLIGGAGYDRMYGGLGDDSYQVNDSTDYAYENAGEGIDRVISSLNNHTLRANVEELELVGAAVSGKGNELGNLIIGNELNNKLSGMAGNDTLEGKGGSDTLDGGAGADTMIGEYGNDQYYVDDAGDLTLEELDQGIDTARTTIDIALAANVENAVLLGSANLNAAGNELNNVMTGNAGDNQFSGGAGVDQIKGLAGNDTLDGGAGGDRLYGGTGHDSYIVDTTGDLIFENDGEGWDSVESSVTYVLAANVENLNLTGSANINGTGNDGDNSINGNDGANILAGGLGEDTLQGEGGADVLKAGAGDDWLEGGYGRDRFYGGEGADVFLFMTPDFSGLTSSTCDQIHDFSQAEGDKIDLGLVDGNVNNETLDDLAFIGTNAFSGTAGQLRYYQSNGQTYVQGDTDGDGEGDFLIRLDGLHNLQASDFLI